MHFDKELPPSASRNLLNTANKVIHIAQSRETKKESLVWPYIPSEDGVAHRKNFR